MQFKWGTLNCHLIQTGTQASYLLRHRLTQKPEGQVNSRRPNPAHPLLRPPPRQDGDQIPQRCKDRRRRANGDESAKFRGLQNPILGLDN